MQKLLEIKRGNEGFGLLVERDAGFIDLKDDRNTVPFQQLNNIGTSLEIVDRLKVVAVMQKYNIENANGRIYPESVLKKQVEIYQQKINDRRSYGEANHPESVTLDLDRLSFGITKLWWEGRTLLGELEFILSPGYVKYGIISCKGDLLANYLRTGWKIGVSSRGLGSVEKDRFTGKYIVQDDFELTCWDAVTDGSTPGSWIQPEVDNLKPYIESKQIKNSRIIEKLDKYLGNKTIL